jgi:hypothetical protein
MRKRSWVAMLSAVALVAAAPAIQPGVAMADTVRLTYYRSPGGNPYCLDECYNGVCCTFG